VSSKNVAQRQLALSATENS